KDGVLRAPGVVIAVVGRDATSRWNSVLCAAWRQKDNLPRIQCDRIGVGSDVAENVKKDVVCAVRGAAARSRSGSKKSVGSGRCHGDRVSAVLRIEGVSGSGYLDD